MGQDREAAALNSRTAELRALALVAGRQQLRSGRWVAPISIGLLCCTALVVAAIAPAPSPWPAAVLGSVLAAIATRPAALRMLRGLRHGWPAPLPLHESVRTLAARGGAGFGAALLGLLMALLLTLADWPAIVALAFALGAFAGAGGAALWPVGRRATSYPESRYRNTRPGPTDTPSLRPLLVDLHAGVSARMRPRALARITAPLLLAAPSGGAPGITLVALAATAAALYLGFLIETLPAHGSEWRKRIAALPTAHDPAGRWHAAVMRSVRVRLLLASSLCVPLSVAMLGPVRGGVAVLLLAAVLDRVAARRLMGRPVKRPVERADNR